MIQVTENGTIVAAYGYDPSGLREIKRVYSGGSQTDTIHYIFEGAEPILEQKMSDGSVHSYVYALGKYLARVDGEIGDASANVYYFLTDCQGSIKAVTDQTGAIVFNADYTPFGTQFGQNGMVASLTSMDLPGRNMTRILDLLLQCQMVRPRSGVYLGRSGADPGSPNLYSYCGNNPVNRCDPSGEFFGIDDALAELMMAAGGVFGGFNSVAHGGSFMAGFALGAFTAGVSCGIGFALEGAGISDLGILGINTLSGGIMGGVDNLAAGGNFFSGLESGALGALVGFGLDKIISGNLFDESQNLFDRLLTCGFKTELRSLISTGSGASFLDAIEEVVDEKIEYEHDERENSPQPDIAQTPSVGDTAPAPASADSPNFVLASYNSTPAPGPGPGSEPATPNPEDISYAKNSQTMYNDALKAWYDPAWQSEANGTTHCNGFVGESCYLYTGSTELMGMTADEQLGYMQNHPGEYFQTNAWTASQYANAGYFAVGITSDHVAQVMPGEGNTHDGWGYCPLVAQHGNNEMINGVYTTINNPQTNGDSWDMSYSWNATAYKNVQFYVKY